MLLRLTSAALLPPESVPLAIRPSLALPLELPPNTAL